MFKVKRNQMGFVTLVSTDEPTKYITSHPDGSRAVGVSTQPVQINGLHALITKEEFEGVKTHEELINLINVKGEIE